MQLSSELLGLMQSLLLHVLVCCWRSGLRGTGEGNNEFKTLCLQLDMRPEMLNTKPCFAA